MKKHIIRFVKKNVFVVVIVSVLAVTLPTIVWQIGRVHSYHTKASSFSFAPYPGLSWTSPQHYKTAFLLNEGTLEEELKFATGQAVKSESGTDISQEVYSFYNTLLTSKGFTQVQTTGDTRSTGTWTVTYQNDTNICQLQYYPTPYTNNNFTFLLFFGSM